MKQNRILLTALFAALLIGVLNLSNQAFSCTRATYHKSIRYHYNSRAPYYAQAQIMINTPIGSFYSRPLGYYPPMHQMMPPPPPRGHHTTITNIYFR